MAISVVIVGCGARGGEVYGRYFCDNGHKIVALCDANVGRLEAFSEELGVSGDRLFRSYDELFACGKIADVCVVSVFDNDHYDVAMKAMALGYDLLLEKPVSGDVKECLAIRDYAKSHGRTVAVCHVMRYTSYYRYLKRVIDDGRLGDLRGIEQTEDVAYWHMAHAFVRGNFRNSDETSPMILQKCCHDMDLLVWLTGRKPAVVTSMGDLSYFNRAHAPEGHAMRCIDCEVKNCPFNAVDFYIGNYRELKRTDRPTNVWPYAQVAVEPDEERLTEALKTGPWGRCVYECDNNVVDRQWATIRFTDGLIGTLTMCGFSADGGRRTHVYGTEGEAVLDEQSRTVTVQRFGEKKSIIGFDELATDFSGHGGGDKIMLDEFVGAVEGSGSVDTDIAVSVYSHVMCYCAEKSRLRGGQPVACADID